MVPNAREGTQVFRHGDAKVGALEKQKGVYEMYIFERRRGKVAKTTRRKQEKETTKKRVYSCHGCVCTREKADVFHNGGARVGA
jgi:hypothetical protein